MLNPAASVPPGFWGNLSPVQEARLQQLWTLLLHLAEASSLGALEQLVRVNTLEQVPSSPSPSISRSPTPSRRNSLFSRTESTLMRKGTRESVSVHHTRLLQMLRDVGLSASQVRSVHKFLSVMSPEDVRFGVLTAAKHEHLDVYLLRYLRVSKWDVNKSLVHLLDSIVWRLKEMQVDNVLLPRGELYAVEQEGNTANLIRSEDARGFMRQVRMGKGFVHGLDRLNRPIAIVRIRLHDPSAQTTESLNQFITHLVESARLLVTPPIETASVLFDMTDFSLANMEYAPVKFIIKCFEIYYPECLGFLLIHNAPRVFNGVWKIIKPWMDPRIVEKTVFTRTVEDLERYIDRDQIIAELGGNEQWEYKYTEPHPEENRAMKDYATRDSLLAERQSIGEEFLVATSRWITASRGRDPIEIKEAIAHREYLIEQIRANYWDLDPYVRARNNLDRTGVIQPGGWINVYPKLIPKPEPKHEFYFEPIPGPPPEPEPEPDFYFEPVPEPEPAPEIFFEPDSDPELDPEPELEPEPEFELEQVHLQPQPSQIQTAKILQVAHVHRAQVKIVNV
ncbi:CRAL-TRIO domain-containing protein [Aspergillus pseudoustus]|uniref:CRAL-TRIO domain-containing protein n=1 Tax=Aspergillus pseudoustus TaxID=1810923 RepID=A0ABR4K7V6_9EURO